jgi:eukaryotic-like serine/threonine-protein kinase
MSARGDADWRNWLTRIEAREPKKARYERFYADLDSSVPGWMSIIKTPFFFEWGTDKNAESGSCIFDMMIECWNDPAWHAEQFATFLRLFLNETTRSASRIRRGMGNIIDRLVAHTPAPVRPTKRHVLSGRYEILKRLGGGGNGNVYLVWSRETLSLCGLKIIRGELWHNADVISRFKKEIEIWVKLGVHPNIVAAHFLDVKDGILYMTMEYVEGEMDAGPSLVEKLQIGNISETDVAKWFVQIADGLGHGYSCGIAAHRDIKPANILVTRDGTAKITDFGLSYPLPDFSNALSGNPTNWAETAPGSLLGTPLYMAPEQFADVSSCDQRSDIYSLGITLYQVVTGGRAPFLPVTPRNPSPSELNRFLREVRSMHESAIPARVRSAFWPVIEKCLKKKPEDRFANVDEFRSAVQIAAKSKGISVPRQPAAGDDIWAYRDKGNTLLRLGKYEEAIVAYDRFLSEFPDDSVLLNKAVSLENLGRLEEALELYQQLCKQGDYRAFVNAAECYKKLDKYDLAVRSASRATEIKPDDGSCWIALGNVKYAMGRARDSGRKGSSSRELYIDAALAYQHAAVISPSEPTPHYNLALARNKSGDMKGASRSLLRFLKIAAPLDERRTTAQELLDGIRVRK